MAISMQEFLPRRLVKHDRKVSIHPKSFRPAHDLRWELEENLTNHTVNPQKNPGTYVGGGRYFPSVLYDLGIRPLIRSISTDRTIGKGPILSAMLTIADNIIEGSKPLQRIYTFQKRRDRAEIAGEYVPLIAHIMEYQVSLSANYNRGTTNFGGPIPAEVNNRLSYHADMMGMTKTDTITWLSAIALAEQPEVHEALRRDLVESLERFGEILILKIDVIDLILKSAREGN